MSSTELSRSAFHAINDHQQIEKYDTLNTYKIILNSGDQVNYSSGDVTYGTHYNFKCELGNNGTQHIKNARARVKFLGMPNYVINSDVGYGMLKWNLSKNVYSTNNGGFATTEPLTMFAPKQVYQRTYTQTEVPTLTTTGAVLDPTLTLGGLKQANNATNHGANLIPSTDAEARISAANMAAISMVHRNNYNFTDETAQHISTIGENMDTGWTPCSNPFGKTIHIQITEADQTDLNTQIGHIAGENTCVVIEVQLIPDSQSNDKFSY